MYAPGMHSSGPRPKSHCGSPAMMSSPTFAGAAQCRCADPSTELPVCGDEVLVVEDDDVVVRRHHPRACGDVEEEGALGTLWRLGDEQNARKSVHVEDDAAEITAAERIHCHRRVAGRVVGMARPG